MIARTEIAAAYNNSEHEAVKQAIKDRIMLPTTEKKRGWMLGITEGVKSARV